MADYTTPPWSQLVAGKPWTDEKAAAAFENSIAIAEGADGAPRLRIGALQRLSAGEEIRVRADAEVSSGTILDIGFIQIGIVRIKFSHRSSSGLASASVIRIRGGEETVLAVYDVGGGFVARTVDCPVLPGDRIKVSSTGLISLCRMQTNGEDYFPVSVTKGIPEGNTYA